MFSASFVCRRSLRSPAQAVVGSSVSDCGLALHSHFARCGKFAATFHELGDYRVKPRLTLIRTSPIPTPLWRAVCWLVLGVRRKKCANIF